VGADAGAEACSVGGQKTCCSGAAERRLDELAVHEASHIVATTTSTLRALVADNAVLYQRQLHTTTTTTTTSNNNNNNYQTRRQAALRTRIDTMARRQTPDVGCNGSQHPC